MIAIVDDDAAALGFLQEVLTGAGLEVAAFPSAAAALAGLAGREPKLVISDVVMPDMSGLDFRRAYGIRFSARRTPFVFLSSLGETGDVVRGLDAGADDYLQKPVPPELLLAKVRSLLRRGSQAAVRAFHGDLGKFPFPKIVEFCELQGLTGEVEVEAEGFRATIPFRGGAVLEGGGADGEAIARAFELRTGTFVIRTQPVDFGEIAAAAVHASDDPPLDPSSRPPGRLSAVTVGDRLVQLQTEYVTTPSPMVVSVGLRDGRTILKRSARASGSREAVARLVEAQHAEVEREVRQKLAELAAARAAAAGPAATPVPAPAADSVELGQLLEAGLNAFLTGDYEGALATWERASALDPSHRGLQVNLAVVRRKLGLG